MSGAGAGGVIGLVTGAGSLTVKTAFPDAFAAVSAGGCFSLSRLLVSVTAVVFSGLEATGVCSLVSLAEALTLS